MLTTILFLKPAKSCAEFREIQRVLNQFAT